MSAIYIICKEHQSCVLSIKLPNHVVTSWFGFHKSVFQARHLHIMQCFKQFYKNTWYWKQCAWLTVERTLKWTSLFCKQYILQNRLSDKWRFQQPLCCLCPSGHGCEHNREPDRDLHCSSEQDSDALYDFGDLAWNWVCQFSSFCVCL